MHEYILNFTTKCDTKCNMAIFFLSAYQLDKSSVGSKWTKTRVCESQLLSSQKLIEYQDTRRLKGCQFLNWSPTGRVQTSSNGMCALQTHDNRNGVLLPQTFISANNYTCSDRMAQNEGIQVQGESQTVRTCNNPWPFRRSLSSPKLFPEAQSGKTSSMVFFQHLECIICNQKYLNMVHVLK